MKLLLDTCTFLWSIKDISLVSAAARGLLTDDGNKTFLSAASVWEIVAKYTSGRLELKDPPEILVPQHREASGAIPLPLDEDACLMQRKLPRLHRDPFDRMLVSQALVHELTILTPDPLIRQYPVRTAW